MSHILSPSQRTADDTQQPAPSSGEAAAGRPEHAQHAGAHAERLQQRPLGVRGPPPRVPGCGLCPEALPHLVPFCKYREGLGLMGVRLLLTVSEVSAKKIGSRDAFCSR